MPRGSIGSAKARAGRNARDGLPGATSRVTTAPAPTSAPAPMRTPPSTTAPDPIEAPRSTTVGSSSQSSAVWSSPEAAVAARPLVVDEHDAVADEHLVLDRDAVADERVALDLAAGADHGAALDLDERADPRAVADRAAVEVRERLHDDVLAEHDVVGDQPPRRVVDGRVSHRRTLRGRH